MNTALQRTLTLLLDGSKTASEVTYALRVYPLKARRKAARDAISRGYVKAEIVKQAGRGRNPVYLSITEVGRSKLEGVV